MRSERSDHAPHESIGGQIPHEPDKIAGRWVERPQRGWVVLAPFLVVVVTDRLEAHHTEYSLCPTPAPLRVYEASHGLGTEERSLFVRKSHHPQCPAQRT